jgi:hypothetical protein
MGAGFTSSGAPPRSWNTAPRGRAAGVAFDRGDEYLVVHRGQENTSGMVACEHEILDGPGLEIGPNDCRISELGSWGDAGIGGQCYVAGSRIDVYRRCLAAAGSRIYGQRTTSFARTFGDGFETGRGASSEVVP